MSVRHLLEPLADFDTALLANTLDYLAGSPPPHERYLSGDIQSLTPSLGPTVGVAMTITIDSSTPGGVPDAEGYYTLLRAIEVSPDPVVLVIKAGGSRPSHECVLGDGMAKMLHSVGCVGVVTDGGVRDIEGILTVPFGVYARGRTVHHCALRYSGCNQPVTVGGVTLAPGDIIHANIGGVITVPGEQLDRLPARATAMRAFEHDAHCVFRRTDLSIDQKRTQVEAMVGRLQQQLK